MKLCGNLSFRLSELFEMRGRSPWLWPDVIYNLSPAGREFNECLRILHGFTDKVYHMAGVLQMQNFSSNVPLNWKF